MLSIDDDDNLQELFCLILACILSNNVIYCSIKNELNNANQIKKFIDTFTSNDAYFKKMIILDMNIDQTYPSIIKLNRRHFGTYIKYSEQKQRINFHDLEHKLFTFKTIYMPRDLNDNTN